ncbi:hypothetical protein AN958_03403 [Leucoagaricus sp. SymC.cos]|nr:hypothetical protein AN958_03403 [Leucoagaricus sp. SymC.cos]
MVIPFLSNAHSIQRLSIHVTRTLQLRQFFTSKAPFANLESLSLVIKHMDIDAATPITIFCDSPCLSRVALDLNFRKASFWVQDAHVLHHSFSLPNSGNGTGASTHASTAPIILPQLTHLSISFYGHHEKTASSLLTFFSLPHLCNFHFFSGFITLSSAAIVISSNRLQTFVASGVDISTAEFRSFATRNPSLCSLTLDLRYCKDDDTSDVLDVPAAEQPRSSVPLRSILMDPQRVTAFCGLIRSRGQNASNKLCLSLKSHINSMLSLPFLDSCKRAVLGRETTR